MGVFEDLMEYKILSIRKKLSKWMREDKFQTIVSEHVFFEDNRIIMHTDEGNTGDFIWSYVRAVRKKFKCDWYLSNACPNQPQTPYLLIGKLPDNHFIILTPARPVKEVPS